jgi:hypothetical protein
MNLLKRLGEFFSPEPSEASDEHIEELLSRHKPGRLSNVIDWNHVVNYKPGDSAILFYEHLMNPIDYEVLRFLIHVSSQVRQGVLIAVPRDNRSPAIALKYQLTFDGDFINKPGSTDDLMFKATTMLDSSIEGDLENLHQHAEFKMWPDAAIVCLKMLIWITPATYRTTLP